MRSNFCERGGEAAAATCCNLLLLPRPSRAMLPSQQWGSLTPRSNGRGGGQTIEVGNWLHSWADSLVRAFRSGNRYKCRLSECVTPSDLREDVAEFIRCLPGTNEALEASQIPASALAQLRVRRASLGTPGCCHSLAEVESHDAARPLVHWALSHAFNKCGVSLPSEPPSIHFRCGDAPFSRHGRYHFMSYSGFAAGVSRLGLQPGTAVRVVTCFHHDRTTNWERRMSRVSNITQLCNEYARDLLRYLSDDLGLVPRLATCEHGMLRDFASLWFAPSLLAGASSMALMAGFFGRAGSNRAFATALTLEEEPSKCGNWLRCEPALLSAVPTARSCAACADTPWLIGGNHSLAHREVVDYANVNDVIQLLRRSAAAAPTLPPTSPYLERHGGLMASLAGHPSGAPSVSSSSYSSHQITPCPSSPTQRTFSSVIVTSAGGVGTTSLLVSLRSAGYVTNGFSDEDGLKHMLPSAFALKLRRRHSDLGERPILIYLYDDPVRALVSLARRGWANFQAFRFGRGGKVDQKAYKDLPCISRARRDFITSQRRAEGAPIANSTPRAALGCRHPGRVQKRADGGVDEMRVCSERLALQSLDAHAETDWVGLGRHWDAWTAAMHPHAVTNTSRHPPSLTVVFARASRLWAHSRELAELLEIDLDCMPQSLCSQRVAPPLPLAPETAAATLRKLDTTFAELRQKHEEMGEFAVRSIRTKAKG